MPAAASPALPQPIAAPTPPRPIVSTVRLPTMVQLPETRQVQMPTMVLPSEARQ